MKFFFLISIIFLSSHVLSGPVLIVGEWATECIHSQMPHAQGYAIEVYAIKDNGEYSFFRRWFKDPTCNDDQHLSDVETGRVTIGKKISTFFEHSDVYEANFITEEGTDLGAIKIETDESLRVARGMRNSTMRNTMVGLFKYRRID